LGCTVSELLGRISSRELSEWTVYNSLEPFTSETDFLGAAIVAQTIVAVNTTKGHKVPTVQEFLPTFSVKQQTPGEMIQVASMFTEIMGGSDLREEKADG
jgi:hypothetical protein